MVIRCRWILVCGLLLAAGPRLLAASAETRAFEAAAKEFQDAFYTQAETDFADFVQRFPNSPRVPEAILFQAEARIKLKNYTGALALLSAHLGQAGKWADEYLFWSADASFQKGDYVAAAEGFARLLREQGNSPRRLEAVVREADARARLSEWARVSDLLQATNGVFQAALKAPVTTDTVPRGQLLLAEALLAQAAYGAAEAALTGMTNLQLSAALEWQRQYLLCRVLLADGRPEAALQASTNLLAPASRAGQRALEAESIAFQAAVLERLGRVEEAMAVYQKNLAEGMPVERQRQALLKISDLARARARLAEGAAMLEKFLAQAPAAETADLALVALGELRLRECEAWPDTNLVSVAMTNAPTLTNCLQQALSVLQAFTNRFPQSPLYGRAELYLGRCFWIEGRLAESQAAFQTAFERLPFSVDQAVAAFKLAEAQFRQTNFSGAITSYRLLLDKFVDLAEVRTNLFEPVLYQIVRAGLAGGDLAAATNAMNRLRAEYPGGLDTERAVLLTGQKVALRDPQGARLLLSEFAARTPGGRLLPEVELAIARTYEQENDWTNAIAQYDRLLMTFTNHEALPRALYCRAWANFQAGQETNALSQYTNFTARYPTHELWPLAQLWIGDHYFRLGASEDAEKTYQSIFRNTNFPPSRLSYEAIMMAGRSAFARQGWTDALDYFSRLASNTNCPADMRPEALAELRARAFYALGDTLISQFSTNKLADYQDALNAFGQIQLLCPSNQMTSLAWGGKANCLLQWAQQAGDYGPATNAYQQVLDAPLADAAARSAASVGLGITLEKMAQQMAGPSQTAVLGLALNQYLNVFYFEKLLRLGEKPDPFWTRKAGLEAARLAEKLQLREQAMNVYRRLKELYPSLRVEEKLSALRAQESEPRGSGE